MSAAEASARTAGQSDVTSEPSSYSLYIAEQYADAVGSSEKALEEARVAGQSGVINSP